ncbi:MAG: alpha/beta hydrolase [Dehalococcoidia bacterium]
MRRGYLATPNGLIHYRSSGDTGENLLLLHQTPFSSTVYESILPRLARYYRVVAIDTPGYGESDPPPPGEWQIADYGRAVLDALDALGWERTHLVGRLTGCSIAVEAAAAAPQRFERLVLSGLPDYDDEVRVQKLAGLSPIVLRADGSQANSIWSFLRNGNPTLPLETVETMTIAMLRAGPLNEEAHRAVFSYDPKGRLPAIVSPTLLLYGQHDYFQDRIEIVRPLFRDVQIQHIPGGRQLVFENEDGFVDAVLGFLGASETKSHSDQLP